MFQLMEINLTMTFEILQKEGPVCTIIGQFFINFNNQRQFWNPHANQIPNLSLIFEYADELTEIIDIEKDEDEINF